MNKDFTHPNILSDGSICLDMLTTSNEPYTGWKSAYTVLSILIDLQSVFYDKYINKEQSTKINQFKCPTCIHSGSSNPYPKFPSEKLNKNLSPEQIREAKLNELCCYLRRTNFKETPSRVIVIIYQIKI